MYKAKNQYRGFQAVQFTSWNDLVKKKSIFLNFDRNIESLDSQGRIVGLKTPYGTLQIREGTWILQDALGNFSALPDSHFNRLYQTKNAITDDDEYREERAGIYKILLGLIQHNKWDIFNVIAHLKVYSGDKEKSENNEKDTPNKE